MKKITLTILTILVINSLNLFAENEIENAKEIAEKIFRKNAIQLTELTFGENWSKSVDSIKQSNSEKIASAFHNAQHNEAKIIFAQYYISILQYWGRIPQDFSFVNSDIVNYLLDSIDVNSNFWDVNSVSYFWACILSGESYSGSLRLEKFLETHKRTDANAWLYRKIIEYSMERKSDTVTAKKYFFRMQEEFPEHTATKSISNTYNLDGLKKIVVGKIIPDFELANLDNENEIISMQSLRGKFVLIHIWGTWCAPCIENLPNLVEAFERLSYRNFTIYSIAMDSKNNVVKFGASKKMPWLHSVTSTRGWNNETMQLLEITGVPTKILISPEGEILWISKWAGANFTEKIEEFLR